MRFPDYPRRLKAKFAGLPGVNWLGQVAESEVRGLFQRAEVVVLPYLASTGSSSVLMQAAAWGRSVVASDLEEIRSAVSENGLDVAFFRRGQAEALAEALRTQLGSDERRCSQVEHNLAALSRRGPEAMCHAYLRAFNLALEASRSPKRIAVPLPSPPERA
jgi:glycosyltransferase involved in cell wall biosynthesis